PTWVTRLGRAGEHGPLAERGRPLLTEGRYPGEAALNGANSDIPPRARGFLGDTEDLQELSRSTCPASKAASGTTYELHREPPAPSRPCSAESSGLDLDPGHSVPDPTRSDRSLAATSMASPSPTSSE